MKQVMSQAKGYRHRHELRSTLVESFHPCYLSNVKQEQMLASVANVKWNAALETWTVDWWRWWGRDM